MVKPLVIISCLVLSACGGSGSSSSSSPSSPAPVTDDFEAVAPSFQASGYNLYVTENPQAGQSVSLAAAATAGNRLTNVSWVQTAGPELTILAKHTQVISFDVHEAGNYQFDFAATLSNGQNVNQAVSLDVEASTERAANIRLDHAAVETAKVSLRVDGDPDKTVASIDWQQTAGPPVGDFLPQDNFLFFDAPPVTADQVVEVAATINYEDGSSAQDTAWVTIQDVEINGSGYFPSADIIDQVVTTDMMPYRKDSPYAQALLACVYNNIIDSSCPFNQLPLLGQSSTTPTINDIMNRVLVSHPWMGERFEQYLEQSVASQDMLKLLRATTAIVISYDIRPSYFWSATGAIYLDAANFWVTPQERDTLNDQPDFRTDFGNDLQFIVPWRYVKDSESYIKRSNYPAAQRLSKTFTDLEANITWLMYHELGHANDFFPPASWQSISSGASPLSYSSDVPANSESFSQSYPLSSQIMKDLAQVRFAGRSPSDVQKSYLPDDIEGFFSPDDSPSFYSYFTIREDYATLFERFMMAYRMGVSSDVAIIGSDDPETLVVWGQRDRINAESLQARTRQVVSQILPDLPAADIQENLPAPKMMRSGESWFDNLNLDESTSTSAAAKRAVTTYSEQQIQDSFMPIRHNHLKPRPVN